MGCEAQPVTRACLLGVQGQRMPPSAAQCDRLCRGTEWPAWRTSETAPRLSTSRLPAYTLSGSCNQGTRSLRHPSPPSQGVECYSSWSLGCQALQHFRVMYSIRPNQVYRQPLKTQASAHDGWRTSRCLANHLRFVADLREPHAGIVGPVIPTTP